MTWNKIFQSRSIHYRKPFHVSNRNDKRHLLTVEQLINFKQDELAWKASWVTLRITISVLWLIQKLDWNDPKNWRFLSFRILTCCVRPKPFKMSRKWLWILGSQYGCWNYHGEWVVRWRTQEWKSQWIWLRRKNWFWEASRWWQLQVTVISDREVWKPKDDVV